jgi:uncharacterized protein (DUF433 family)
MLAVIQKWDNLPGIPLTPEILNQTQLSIGDEVFMNVQKGQIVIKFPVQGQDQYDLKNLVAHNSDSLILETPGICGGSPRIRNTRIPVRSLVQYRQYGTSDTELLEIYPTLHQGDLEAAWNYYALHQDEIDQEIEEENSL